MNTDVTKTLVSLGFMIAPDGSFHNNISADEFCKSLSKALDLPLDNYDGSPRVNWISNDYSYVVRGAEVDQYIVKCVGSDVTHKVTLMKGSLAVVALSALKFEAHKNYFWSDKVSDELHDELNDMCTAYDSIDERDIWIFSDGSYIAREVDSDEYTTGINLDELMN